MARPERHHPDEQEPQRRPVDLHRVAGQVLAAVDEHVDRLAALHGDEGEPGGGQQHPEDDRGRGGHGQGGQPGPPRRPGHPGPVGRPDHGGHPGQVPAHEPGVDVAGHHPPQRGRGPGQDLVEGAPADQLRHLVGLQGVPEHQGQALGGEAQPEQHHHLGRAPAADGPEAVQHQHHPGDLDGHDQRGRQGAGGQVGGPAGGGPDRGGGQPQVDAGRAQPPWTTSRRLARASTRRPASHSTTTQATWLARP